MMKLVLANKNYSSWSLRAWLIMKMTGLDFEEILIPLDRPDTAATIARYTPSGRVPVLIDGAVRVWDSLAITEYMAEKVPTAGIWPRDPAARAVARAIVAEMHAGFQALRAHYPMNIRRPPRPRAGTAASARDLERIGAIWREARQTFGHGGPYLFGAFSAADAFYAPVASRLHTYALDLGPVENAYIQAIFAHPAMEAWCTAAYAETAIVPSDEVP